MAKIIFDLNGTLVREGVYDPKKSTGYTLFDGIFELLNVLKQDGHEIFIWTMASKRATLAVINHYKLHDFFIDYLTIEKGFIKPDRSGIYELIGLDKEAFMIGDSLTDIQAGKNAGITSIAALWGSQSDDRIQNQSMGVKLAFKPMDVLTIIRG